MHIILVDDDQLTLFVHKRVIENVFKNATISSYSDPSKLIEELRNDSIKLPDMIFSDYNMGDLNGVDVLNAFESVCMKNYQSLKPDFFLVSSEIDIAEKASHLNHQIFNTYLEKPLTKEKINNLFFDKIAS